MTGLGVTIGAAAAGVSARGAGAEAPKSRRGQLTTLNVSTDMSLFGLPNMTPNSPGVNSTMLLNTAIVLGSRYGVTTITADPGTYYFPLGPRGQYIVLSGVSGLTIDLQGSSLIFQGTPGTAIAQAAAIQATGCTDLTLQNFSVDYDPLPFSQYVITDINGSALTLAPQAGFPGVAVFNTQPPQSTLRGWPFRNGARLYGVDSFQVTVASPNSVTVTASPGSGGVSELQRGDTLVIQLRSDEGESAALSFQTPVRLTVQNVDIYSAGVQGIGTHAPAACLFAGVRVIPPPGTSRLVSSNGGGVVLQQAGPNNRIVGCTFIGVQDDSIGVNSLAVGVIASVPGPRTSVTLANPQGLTGLDPAALSRMTTAVFVSDTNCQVYGPIAVKSIDVANLTVTFVEPVPTEVATNFLLCDPLPAHRGAGLVVSGNRVLRSCFARGMTFWGLSQVLIEGNYLDGTLLSGIDVLQKTTEIDWRCQPNDLVTVRGNVLQNCNQSSNAANPEAAGAIVVHSLAAGQKSTTAMPNTAITIQNNYVVNTPRAGLSLQNILGGSAGGDVLQLTSPPVVVQNSSITQGPMTSDSAIAISVSPAGAAVSGGTASAQLLTNAGPPAGTLRFLLVDSTGASFTPTVTGAWPSFQFVVPPAAALGVAALQISAGATPVARGGTFIVGTPT